MTMSLKELPLDSFSQDHSSLDPEKNTTDPVIEEPIEDESEYLIGLKLSLVVLGLCLAVLLVGLVRRPFPMFPDCTD